MVQTNCELLPFAHQRVAAGMEHINLTADYVWRLTRRAENRKFRPYGRFPRLSALYIPFREATSIL